MKKRGFLFFTLVTIIIVVVAVPACKMQYDPKKVEYVAVKDNGEIQEGKRLAVLMCAPCHYNEATKKFSGALLENVPGIVGKVYSKNITQHPTKGIASYTDAELAYLIRTGIGRDGKLMPYMQKPNLANEDLDAIIAFLRSDDELVKPVDIESGKTKYTVVGKLGISRSKPFQWPSEVIGKPDKADRIAIGKYLVDNLLCYSCHSKSVISVNKKFPEKSKGYMGGGSKLKDRSRSTIVSPNLTANTTGIGNWTEQDFVKAMRAGISKDNSIITYPMPTYNELTDTELSAIFAYLKTIPSITNKIKKK